MRLRFVHIALGLILAAAIFTATSSAAEPCPALRLDAITPGQGSAGDTVQLEGKGFCGGPQSFFAWGWDGARGFPIEIDGVKAGLLSGILGPVSANFSGPIRLWSGDIKKLERQSINPAGARSSLSGSILRVTNTASGGHLRATKSADAVSSSSDSGALRLPLPPPPSERSAGKKGKLPTGEISIIIVVETCGPPDEDEETEDEGSTAVKRFVGRLNLQCHERERTCRRHMAKTVASAIDQGFNSMGLRARVDDRDIVISRRACPITAGFATISQ